jgi:hypothetical protein
MINATNVVSFLLERVKQEYKNKLTICTAQEKDVAYQLFLTLQSVLETPGTIEKENYLEFAESYELDDNGENDEETDLDEEEVFSQSSQEWEFFEIEKQKFDLDYMKRAVECYDSKGWRVTQHNFKRLKQRNYITRFREYILKQGTKSEKMSSINDFVLEKFNYAMTRKSIVHDKDLKRWALWKKKQVQLLEFSASDTWVFNFKRKNRIVSRKITKYVSIPRNTENVLIEETARNFVDNAITKFENYKLDHILNTDQSGFNYLEHSSHTLAIRGQKSVVAGVSSVSATTHSYTIQPTVSLSGSLVGKLYICLQETDGKFGPQVQKSVEEHLIKCRNIVVTASKSGKLQKGHVKYWVDNILLNSVSEKCILLPDSWSEQKDSSLFNSMSGPKPCLRLQIPPKATQYIQPLDIYGFRQWKTFARKITDIIELDNIDIDLKIRLNIITMHSLIYDQLSSSKFNKMWQYSWYKSGYTNTQPGLFQNVIEVCFSLVIEQCEENCQEIVFIQCSHCEKSICFNHFFFNYHNHIP